MKNLTNKKDSMLKRSSTGGLSDIYCARCIILVKFMNIISGVDEWSNKIFFVTKKTAIKLKLITTKFFFMFLF